MNVPEYTRIVRDGTKKYAEFTQRSTMGGVPCFEWWDIEMCHFKYKLYKEFKGSDGILKAISDLS